MTTTGQGARVAVYPGSFDPVTLGHLDMIQRAAKLYDKLIVAVLNNTSKKPLFSVEERIELLTKVTAHIPNVEVDEFSGLLIQYMQQQKASVIIRGLRAVSDYEYELQIAAANRAMNDSVETLFMLSSPNYSFLSSSIVKEIARFHGNISELVSPEVEVALKSKFST